MAAVPGVRSHIVRFRRSVDSIDRFAGIENREVPFAGYAGALAQKIPYSVVVKLGNITRVEQNHFGAVPGKQTRHSSA